MKVNIQIMRLILALMLSVFSVGVIAANSPETELYNFTSLVSMKTLQSRIKEIESGSGFDEATQERLLDLYRKSIRYLEEAQTYNGDAEKFIQARKVAPKLAARIRKKLEKNKKQNSEIRLSVNLKTPFAVVQQHLFTEKANLAAVEAKLTDLKLQLAFIASRANSIFQQLNEAKQAQEKIFAKLESQNLDKQSPMLVEAQKWALQTQAQTLRAKIRMLDQELLSQPMRIDLLKAQIERQEFSVDYLSKKVKLLNDIVNTLRKKEAEKTLHDAEKAKQEAVNQHPVNRYLARENARLSTDIHNLATELDRVSAIEERIKKQTKRITNEFSSTRKKVEIAGLSHVLGQILLEQRVALPDIRILRDQEDSNEDKLSEAALTGIRHKEELRQIIQNKENYILTLKEKFKNAKMKIDRKDLDKLISTRRELLEKIIDLDDVYFRTLGELRYKQRKLITTVTEYHDFLVGRLLWVRTSPYPSVSRLLSIPRQIEELANWDSWLETKQVVVTQIQKSPGLLLLFLMPLTLLLITKKLRFLLLASSKKSGQFSEESIRDTLKAIFFSLLLASPGPIMLLISAWALHQSLATDDFSRAIAAGLFWVAPNYFYLRAMYVLCKPGGVLDAHFGWPLGFLTLFRRELKRLMIIFLLMAFFTSFVMNLEMTRLGGELGRIFAVCTQLILVNFFYRVFSKKDGVLRDVYRLYPQHAITRFSWLWFSLTGLYMLILTLFTLAGYVYTGAILTNLLLDSVMLVMVLVFAQQLSMRWLLIVRHRLAKKAAGIQETMTETKENRDGDSKNKQLFEVKAPKIDFYTLSQDTRVLLDTSFVVLGIVGLGWLWSEVLPAFQFLGDITLWYHASTDSVQSEAEAVTLADLSLAGVIAVGAYILAKRLPALLEIFLLQLSTSAGSRYTITTLTKYAIVTVGFTMAFNMLGVGWSQLQWLIAALGVGIGFGLQEIVANFICGLIILFERPIRVGDVVTVGDTDGVVTRIQIRATTIRNWDKKELLVPNKEFVTGRLLNWTLSDEVTRILVTVGVAYGSDIQQAKSLMLEIADSMGGILKDPTPSVTFESFGDNALTLVLRCYVPSLNHRLSTISCLHEEINQKFSDAGISIAFPQRDIHLDTLKPLDVRINYPEAQSSDVTGNS